MSRELLLIILAATLMSFAALTIFLLGRQREMRNSVLRRLDQKLERRQASIDKIYRFTLLQYGYRMLQRANLERHSVHLLIGTVILALVCAIAFRVKGSEGLLIAVGVIVLGTYLVMLWREASTHRILLKQLPGFIDHIIRIMTVGRSFESALVQAITDCPPPLSQALENVVIENSLGGDLVESLQESAQIYRMQELHLITMALRINQRYGGSIRAMLENIITLIRQREQAVRELKALTGETRLTAWMLGTMPVAIAGYMMITNPAYIGYLVEDPHGPQIIYTALGLQTFGGLLLWRMMRSIQ